MNIVKIKLEDDGKIPTKGTNQAAGFDLYANESVTLKPGEIKMIKLGISTSIPEGYVGMIRPRSGLATKHGLDICTSGIIDADFRGEWKVTLINHGNKEYTVANGERIAQTVFLALPPVMFELVDDLDATDRGNGGWGSTGKQ